VAGKITEMIDIGNPLEDGDLIEIADDPAGTPLTRKSAISRIWDYMWDKKYPRTAGEIAASVTPVDYSYPPGHLYRYVVNVTPGTTDLLTGFNAAHDSFDETDDDRYGAIIRFPADRCFFSDTLKISKRVFLKGEGRGEQNDTAGTQLIFPKDIDCIRIYSSVVGDGPPGTTSGAWTTIEDLMIWAKDYGTAVSGIGIHATATPFLNRVGVRNVGGHGIYIAGGQVPGLANEWSVTNCFVKSIGGDCIHVFGNDANAGHSLNNDYSDAPNGWSIWDESGLGNLYESDHMNNNGVGTVHTSGGSNESMFLYCYAEQAGSNGHEIAPPAMIIGGYLAKSPPYPKLDITGDGSGAAGTVLTNVSGVVTGVHMTNYGSGYTTASAAIDYGVGTGSGATFSTSIVNGGVDSVNVTAGGAGHGVKAAYTAIFIAAQGGWRCWNGFDVEMSPGGTQGRLEIGFPDIPLSVKMLDEATKLECFKWNSVRGCHDTQVGGVVAERIVTSASTGSTGGRSSSLDPGSVMFPAGLWLGFDANGRHLSVASAMPTSGEYAEGDIVFYSNPTDLGTSSPYIILGWIRRITGTNHVLGTDWSEMRVLIGDIAPYRQGVIDETTTARTLAASDENQLIRCTNASAVTITLPLNATVAIEVGAKFWIEQANTGLVTVSPAASVTLNLPGATAGTTVEQHRTLWVQKVTTDVWHMGGDFS